MLQKIEIDFTFLVLARPGSPEKRAVRWVLFLLPNAICKMQIFLENHVDPNDTNLADHHQHTRLYRAKLHTTLNTLTLFQVSLVSR